MPTEQPDLQCTLAVGAGTSWDGVSERLKLQPAWLTTELRSPFRQCKT